MRRILSLLYVMLASVSPVLISTATAAEYPDHPIKMLTMVNPGAQIDLLARALAEELKNELGQPVLVSNNPGGSHGSVMATGLAASPADGYTLGVSATAAFTYSPYIMITKYTLKDFEFLTLLGLNQSGIICRPDRPWKTLKDAFTWAKGQGRGLTYMFQGSDDRDVVKRIAAGEGVPVSLMPSTGGPSIIAAVLGGHADIGHTGAIMFDYIADGKLRILAATTPVRLSVLPDVPTLKDLGWNESVEMYVVLAAPTGLPDHARIRLNSAIDAIGKKKEFRDFITRKLRMREVDFGPAAAHDYIVNAAARFAKGDGQ
ncbi:MAG: tripartite tricarboxylate transporter substrate binding protein [Desulfovibrio sp.]|jgi:tripartite-type tricarboxylate transporter receptor subunit TctC|nr:tripartite tricarboxylate transporter substrate binding protein [Desulfovibrio sp.]